MRTKGIAFISRRDALIEQFGQARWDAFFQEYRAADKFFEQPVLATTLMPSDRFMAFNDRVVETFYGGNTKAFWAFGERSAQWVLTTGPYKRFHSKGDVVRFAELVPQVWSSYHDAGECGATVREDGAVDIFCRKVPVQHIYFEYTLIGFLQRGFELVAGRPYSHMRLLGFSKGDAEVSYRLKSDPK